VNSLEGSILQVIFRGTRTEALVELKSGATVRGIIDSRSINDSSLAIGSPVVVKFSSDDTHIFAKPEALQSLTERAP
jgi:molybdopterin-binding protein